MVTNEFKLGFYWISGHSFLCFVPSERKGKGKEKGAVVAIFSGHFSYTIVKLCGFSVSYSI